jgi:hypothetical protein
MPVIISVFVINVTFRTKSLLMKISILLLFLNILPILNIPYISASEFEVPTYMITTIGSDPIHPIEFQQGPGYNGNYQYGDVIQMLESCPPEIVIFVHGWGVSPGGASEQLDRVKMSLEKSNYSTTLIGFNWGSNIDWVPAKELTKDQGEKLSKFVSDYKDTCKNKQDIKSDVRLLGHSMGARVILNALDELHNSSQWNNNNFTISSVTLVGAAVDDEEVSTDPVDIITDPTNADSEKASFGNAIQNETTTFYNLYDPEDKALGRIILYPHYENDNALGLNGYQINPKITLPKNYDQINVINEIKPIFDADGIGGTEPWLCYVWYCYVDTGDNHLGYMGFRDLSDKNRLADNGAMNIVISEWWPIS